VTPRPLDQVLAHAWGDFTPEHPGRAPWLQPMRGRVELAYTGNVVTVPLGVADRVCLHGLDRPSWSQDELEPTDWMPVGWGVAPS
jgi:hypothetical protein